MPVKIRLTRHGKKHKPYYHIVVADSRAPRDGKYIEVIGNYDPNTNPATIEVNQDKALTWLKNGAQPTDTCRAILAYKGVLFNLHLQKGIAKGALTQEQADAKLVAWADAKAAKVEEKRIRVIGDVSKVIESRLVEEAKKKETRLDALRKKNTPPPTPEPEAETAAAPTASIETEVVAEAPTAAAEPEVVAETPAEEKKSEGEAPAEA